MRQHHVQVVMLILSTADAYGASGCNFWENLIPQMPGMRSFSMSSLSGQEPQAGQALHKLRAG